MFNILVIDDDKEMVATLMKAIKRADTSSLIGEIVIDDDIKSLKMLEEYNPTCKGLLFDVALIDYQLYEEFSGILVSAWIALNLRIPRLTLTSARYPGNPDYFNGQIEKREITNDPQSVIQRIIKCIEEYNAEQFLQTQYQELVTQFHRFLNEDDSALKPELEVLQALLDKFERALDAKQDSEFEMMLRYEQQTNEFLARHKENENKIAQIYTELQHLIRGEYHE